MNRTDRALIVAVAVMIALVVGIAAGTGAVAGDDEVTIELEVTTPDGEGIGGATAIVEWEDGSTEQTTFSNGRLLADVPEGADLTITLEHSDYVKNVPVEVENVQDGDVIETTMYPSTTAAIEIVDGDGPVENARVIFVKTGQGSIADRGETGADGIYESGEVEEGTYQVTVERSGYLRERFTLDLEGHVEERVEIERETVRVTVRTQDVNLEPPERIRADVTAAIDGEHVSTVTTSRDDGIGSFSLGVNTRYDVRAEAEGYQPAETALRVREEPTDLVVNMSRTPALAVSPDNERVVVGETVRIEVYDEYERPAEDVTIALNGEAVGETDETGVARVEIPGAGDHELTAERNDVTSDPVTITGIGTDDQDDEPTDDRDDDTDDEQPGFGIVAGAIGVAIATAALLRYR